MPEAGQALVDDHLVEKTGERLKHARIVQGDTEGADDDYARHRENEQILRSQTILQRGARDREDNEHQKYGTGDVGGRRRR